MEDKIKEIKKFISQAEWFFLCKESGHLKETAIDEYDIYMKKVKAIYNILSQ